MPDFRRKLNTSPVPRLGGIGFFLSFFTVLIIKGVALYGFSPLDISLLLAGGLSLLFGAVDDFFDLTPLCKLTLQIICAVCAMSLAPQTYPIYLALPFVLLMMNAYNFIDGLDALAASLSLSSLLFISLSALLFLNTGMGVTPLLLFFSVLGFIPLNAHPASLYMGECGSSTLGVSIAVIMLSLPPPLLLLAVSFSIIPIFDALVAIPRRLLCGRSPFSADRGHLHHRLLSLGVSHPAAVNFLLLLSVLLSLISIFAFILLG